jgi:hypothetical protein
MELLLKRDAFTDRSSIGKLYVDGLYECETLEDVTRPVGQRIFGQTAIPLGRYEVRITNSPRFTKLVGYPVDLPLLIDVPGYEGIRIHSGNTDEDTEGCILVGKSRGVDVINDSRDAFAALFLKLKSAQGPIYITVAVPEPVPQGTP